MPNRYDFIKENLQKLSKIKDILIRILEANQSTIKSLSWMNQRITGSKRDIDFAEKLYLSYSEKKIDEMPDSTYAVFVEPLTYLVNTEEIFHTIETTAGNIAREAALISGIVSSSTGTAAIATGSSATNVLFLKDTVETSQDQIDLIEEYSREINVDLDIEYIKKELLKITPDISIGFNHFLETYFATVPDSTKYQEIIGARSLLFFSLIFKVAESFGVVTPANTRRDQIAKFVYGSNSNRDSSADTVIDETMNLWKELSDQDPSGLSVKTGNVTNIYINIIFKKIIIVLSTLLKQREIYFSS